MTSTKDIANKKITMTPSDLTDKPPTIPVLFGGFGPPARFRQRANAIDAKNYDFRAGRTHLVNPNSVAESAVHMLMFGMGAAIVVMHEGYAICGIWTAVAVNLAVGVINAYSVCTLVWSAQKVYGRVNMPQLTYPDVAEASVHLSPWPKLRKASRAFRYIVEGTLMLHLYGNCSVMILMLAKNLMHLVEGEGELGEAGKFGPPLRVYILSLMLPCAVVCMVTDLKNLAPFALIADLYAITVTLMTVWLGIRHHTESLLKLPPFNGIQGLFEFCGLCVFTLESASIALPIENNMNEPHRFHHVVFVSAPIVTSSMMMIGFFGYWLYGTSSTAPITVHFPFTPFPVTLKVFLCLILWVIFAVCFYVAFDIEWFYIKRHHQLSNYWFWERLYRTIHVIVVTMIAYSLPDISRIMGFLGSFATTPAIFLYPPFIGLILDWEYPGLGRFKWRMIRFVFVVIFGLTLFGAGTYYNIISLIDVMQGMTFNIRSIVDDEVDNETMIERTPDPLNLTL